MHPAAESVGAGEQPALDVAERPTEHGLAEDKGNTMDPAVLGILEGVELGVQGRITRQCRMVINDDAIAAAVHSGRGEQLRPPQPERLHPRDELEFGPRAPVRHGGEFGERRLHPR